MLCEEIMKRKVECVGPRDDVLTAARKMRDENIGFLPVCDESGAVIGTLTDRDIAIRLVAENHPASTAVSDVMTRDVVSCRPSDDIREAERLMSSYQKSRIVCIDENTRLVGVISLSDIAQMDNERIAGTTLRKVTERESTAHS